MEFFIVAESHAGLILSVRGNDQVEHDKTAKKNGVHCGGYHIVMLCHSYDMI